MVVACYVITATITGRTPLHIGSGKRTGVIKHTHPHIPGSFLRGSAGVCLLKVACKLDKPILNHEECEYFEDCLYTSLYGEEAGKSSRIFFRYAYPLHLKCGDGVYRPAPKTTYVCSNRQCGEVYHLFEPPMECERCGKSVKPFVGYICSACGELNRYPTPTTRVTLTALDRARYSAAQIPTEEEPKGTLHTIELIDKGAKFRLEVVVDSECKGYLNQVKAILQEGMRDEGVGGGKSRGFGKIEVEDLRIHEVTAEALRKRAEEIDTANFLLEATSPMILGRGRILEPPTLLEAARRAYTWCFHEGKPRLPEVELVERRYSYETFSGWSLKEDRRRRIEPALSPGSVFRFKSDGVDETLALSLAALELQAVGSYKPHGCGQLRVVT
ncbi:MAG: RAMP superfamily CRISPR-associated protein [Candidatus Bathyarchaeia archaeon]